MISVIIPTYNESGNIKKIIQVISRTLRSISFEIIVVDDDSPDGTWKIVKKLQKKHSYIKLFRRINIRGLTSAFNLGIAKSRGNLIAWLDSDLSHPPALLTRMIAYFPRYDAVIASRYVRGGSDSRQEKLAVIFSWIINHLCQLFIDSRYTDYTSGYILIKKSVLSGISLKGDYGEYFIDLYANLISKNAKIKELPYVNVSRIYGQSKTAVNLFGFIKRGRKYLITLLRLWLKK